MSTTAKLDSYDYKVTQLELDHVVITIKVHNNSDVAIADIATDINGADGQIYVEGNKYTFESMDVQHNFMDNSYELFIFCKPNEGVLK